MQWDLLEMVWEWKHGRKSREDDVDSIARMFQELELVLDPESFTFQLNVEHRP